MRFAHRFTPQEFVAGWYEEKCQAAARANPGASCGGVHTAKMPLEDRDVAFAKAPLPAFFEGRDNAPARKFVHRVRAEVEQKRDLAGVQQYIVLIGHHFLSAIGFPAVIFHRRLSLPPRTASEIGFI
jgi:hypothetical protein